MSLLQTLPQLIHHRPNRVHAIVAKTRRQPQGQKPVRWSLISHDRLEILIIRASVPRVVTHVGLDNGKLVFGSRLRVSVCSRGRVPGIVYEAVPVKVRVGQWEGDSFVIIHRGSVICRRISRRAIRTRALGERNPDGQLVDLVMPTKVFNVGRVDTRETE